MDLLLEDFNLLKKLIIDNDVLLLKINETYMDIKVIYKKYLGVHDNIIDNCKSPSDISKYNSNRETYYNVETLISNMELCLHECIYSYRINKNIYLSVLRSYIIHLRTLYYKYLKYVTYLNLSLQTVDYYNDCVYNDMNNAKNKYVDVFQTYNGNIVEIINILEKIYNNSIILCVNNNNSLNVINDVLIVIFLGFISLMLYLLNNNIIIYKNILI